MNAQDKKFFLNLTKYNLTSGSYLPNNAFYFVLTDYFDQRYSYNFSMYPKLLKNLNSIIYFF